MLDRAGEELRDVFAHGESALRVPEEGHRGVDWTRKGAANIMRARLEMAVPTAT